MVASDDLARKGQSRGRLPQHAAYGLPTVAQVQLLVAPAVTQFFRCLVPLPGVLRADSDQAMTVWKPLGEAGALPQARTHLLPVPDK